MENTKDIFKHTWFLLEDVYRWAETKIGREIIEREGECLGEVDDDEVVVGIVPENIRPIMVYGHWLKEHVTGQVLNGIVDKIRDGKDSMGQQEQDKMACASIEIEMYRKIFWNELRHALNIYAMDIGIRKGWVVVKKPDDIDTEKIFKQVMNTVKTIIDTKKEEHKTEDKMDINVRSKTND